MINFSANSLYANGVLNDADMYMLGSQPPINNMSFGSNKNAFLSDVFVRKYQEQRMSLLKPACWLGAICLALKFFK